MQKTAWFLVMALLSRGPRHTEFRVQRQPAAREDRLAGDVGRVVGRKEGEHGRDLVGVRRICEEAGIDVGELQNILHGTTVATNAVLESKGARVGLITTKGFGQILHLARSQTPGPLAGRDEEGCREAALAG